MKKVYYLSTCDTCGRIINELSLKKKGFAFQDIKTEKITTAQLEEMKKLSGSYESLFSRVALKYRALGLNNIQLSEADYKRYMLEEYTFLKRPVILAKGFIFIGNSKANIAAIRQVL